MVSVGKLAAGPTAGRYYVEQVAQGREDYYAGDGEAAGEWVGSAPIQLGLAGTVQDDELVTMLASRDPATDRQLRRPLGHGAVAGFDVTFRAPKSVSVVFEIADPEAGAQVCAGHEAAVREALDYLERHGCWTRRGHAGAIEVRGGGFLAAAFRHRSSRAGDPLLHTHVVIANATQGPDGRWTALDGRRLYEHQKTVGYLYQAALRRELTERLGLEWGEVRNGVADVAGIDRVVIEHFSRRRAEILDELARRGEQSARSAEVATLATRRRKSYDVPVHRLRAEWRARAAEHGLDRDQLEHLLRYGTHGRQPEDPSLRWVVRELEGPEGLTAQASTFGRREVLRAVAEAYPDGARVADVERLADAFLARATILGLGDGRYTTVELARTERDLLAGAQQRRGAGVAVADREAVDQALVQRPTLTGEQAELVRAVTRSGAGIEAVRAPAGTGKTFALDAAREAWQHSGVPVIGCTIAARAACELRDQTGIDAMTIASLKQDLDWGRALAAGGVLIVDEAGMVGTRDLATLAMACEQVDGKLLLVGDDRQLPEIHAGGAFRALADQLPAHALTSAQRQRESWDREALAALRDGDVEAWATAYHREGRLSVSTTADQARDQLVADWWTAHQAGRDALMIAHRRVDVADLNRRARQLMREAGCLGADELEAGTRAIAVGDRVCATRNDRALRILNGHRGQVFDAGPSYLGVRLDSGETRLLPSGYVAEHLDHGYATTAHRAQGATVDQAFVLGSDELYREWGYTALSRHRDQARFYITAPRPFLNQPAAELAGREEQVEAAIEGLRKERRRELAIASRVDAVSRLQRLTAERAGLRWWQRRERRDVGRAINAASSLIQAHDDTLEQTDDAEPAGQAPWRRVSPRIDWEPPTRDHDLPAPELDRDVGLDL
jgi:conjugative relaxase-like TrwC/TraI family protein